MPAAVIALRNIYTKNKSTFLLALKILIGTGILIFILNKVDLVKIFSAFKGSNKILILIASILSLLNIFLQYLKWKLVCNSLLEEHNQKKIFLSLFYGFSAGSFTPARIGEYFGRAISFTGKPLLQVTAATIIDKFFTLIVVLAIGTVSFLFYLNYLSGSIGLLILSAILFYLVSRTGSNTLNKNYFLTKLLKFKRIASLYGSLSFIKNVNYKFKVRLILLSILFYTCFIIQFALLVSAFTNHFNFFGYIWAGNLVMFTKTIIPAVSFGELGIREGASVYFVKKIGETAAAGFNASLFLFLINILLPALTGLILLIRKK